MGSGGAGFQVQRLGSSTAVGGRLCRTVTCVDFRASEELCGQS